MSKKASSKLQRDLKQLLVDLRVWSMLAAKRAEQRAKKSKVVKAAKRKLAKKLAAKKKTAAKKSK